MVKKNDATAILATTVRLLVDRAGTQKKTGKVAQTTVSRLKGNKTRSNPRLSTLQQLADSHKLQVWQLLVPDFDPRYPPKLAGEGDAYDFKPHEIDLLMDFRELAPANKAIIKAAIAAALDEQKAIKEPA